MSIVPDLRIKGFFGETSHDWLAFNFAARDVWLSALRRHAVSGLRRYGRDAKEFELFRNKQQSSSEALPPIGLLGKATYPDTQNQPGAWSATTGTAAIETVPNPFGNGAGLFHSDGRVNQPIAYSGPLVAANQGICLALLLFKPDEDQQKKQFVATWDLWRFEVNDGQPRVTRYNTEYEADSGDIIPVSSSDRAGWLVELEALEAESELTAEQEDEAGELRRKLYLINQTVSIRGGSIYDRAFEIQFEAEGRGIVRISIDGEEVQELTDTGITKTRAVGTLWNSSYLSIRSEGGQTWMWKVGNPHYPVRGKLRLPAFRPGFHLGNAGGLQQSGSWDTSFPGTGVTFGLNELEAPDPEAGNFGRYEPVLTLTGDGTGTPYVYTAEGFVAAGPRTGDGTVVWTTEDYHDHNDLSPIQDVAPTFEPDRRMSYKVTMRCMRREDGTVELVDNGATLPDLHDRMCDLLFDGEMELKNGIVKSVTFNDLSFFQRLVAGVYETLMGKIWPGGNSTISLEISDPNFLLDEDTMTDDPIGDGLRLGEYGRTILKGLGFHNELGLSSQTGRRLPTPSIGQPRKVRPGTGVSRGDYWRGLVERYGRGLKTWWDSANGQWMLAMPDTTVKYTFSSEGDPEADYQIDGPIDLPFDYAETFNAFYAEGAPDPVTGENISLVWLVFESIRRAVDRRHIGRVKWHADLQDEAWETEADLEDALRSTVANRSLPGRFLQFNCIYVKRLFPGDRVRVDGVLCEVYRIPSGSLQDRTKMQIVVRRLD